jgi:hypothetical protein
VFSSSWGQTQWELAERRDIQTNMREPISYYSLTLKRKERMKTDLMKIGLEGVD